MITQIKKKAWIKPDMRTLEIKSNTYSGAKVSNKENNTAKNPTQS